MTDFLGFDDPETAAAARGPAFYAPWQCGPLELEVHERMHRVQAPGCAGADVVLFEDDDDYDAPKIWQKLLDWPRPPTVEEIMAVKISREARLVAAYWGELRDAIAQDAANGFKPNIGPPRAA
jgi:hypothetical protein